MLLRLSQLRADFKAIYKKKWALAIKINVLIEATKIEIKFQSHLSSAAKRIELSKILRSAKISMRTLQRWKQSYRLNGINDITSKRLGHPPKRKIPSHITKLIELYRKQYRWGSEVIQAHLLHDHSIQINRYLIDRFLHESGLKKQYPCTTSKKLKTKKKKHTKKVVVLNPGEHTQMDVKYQLHLLEDKSKAYVYNFIDHASNWSYKRAYSAINTKNTEDFMERLIKTTPFKIERLQTDNGIEFTFKWASKHYDDPKQHRLFKICYRESINHKLIPPGEKELQGLVERSHRQDDQELFSRIVPKDIHEFNCLLEEYYLWRNQSRRFKKLSWLTANQWLQCYFDNVVNLPPLLEWKHQSDLKKAA